jgi:hypothetical protein
MSEIADDTLSWPETETVGIPTPPASVPGVFSENAVPTPGGACIIKSPCGHVLTISEGMPVLEKPGGYGSVFWSCIETDGWLGFVNSASGRLLGHMGEGQLVCMVTQHLWNEYIVLRAMPDGGFIIKSVVDGKLLALGQRKKGQGFTIELLPPCAVEDKNAVIWKFIQVESEAP